MCRFNCFDWNTIDEKDEGNKQVPRQSCLLKDDLHGKKNDRFSQHATSAVCKVSCDQMKVYLSDLKAEIERSGFWKLLKFKSPFTDYKLVPSGFKDNPWDYSEKGFTADDLCAKIGDNFRITVMEVDHYLNLAKKAKPQDLIEASKGQTTQIYEQPKENKVFNPLPISQKPESMIKNPSETSQHKLSAKPQVDPIQNNLPSDLNTGLTQSTHQQSNKVDLTQQLLLGENHPAQSILTGSEELQKELTPKFGLANSINDNPDLMSFKEEVPDRHIEDPLLKPIEHSGNFLHEEGASQQLGFSFQDPLKTSGVPLNEDIKLPGNIGIDENGSGLKTSSKIGSPPQSLDLSKSLQFGKSQKDLTLNKSLRSLSRQSLREEELQNSIQSRLDEEHPNSINRDPLNHLESLSVTETQKKSKLLSEINSPEKTLQSLNQSPKKLEDSLVHDDPRNSMLKESLSKSASDLKSSLAQSNKLALEENPSVLRSRTDLEESLKESQEHLENPFRDLQASKLFTREQLVL